jgi:hypothetical protein
MKNEEGKQNRNVSGREFLAGSGSAVICGAIGAGILPGKASASVAKHNCPCAL